MTSHIWSPCLKAFTGLHLAFAFALPCAALAQSDPTQLARLANANQTGVMEYRQEQRCADQPAVDAQKANASSLPPATDTTRISAAEATGKTGSLLQQRRSHAALVDGCSDPHHNTGAMQQTRRLCQDGGCATQFDAADTGYTKWHARYSKRHDNAGYVWNAQHTVASHAGSGTQAGAGRSPTRTRAPPAQARSCLRHPQPLVGIATCTGVTGLLWPRTSRRPGRCRSQPLAGRAGQLRQVLREKLVHLEHRRFVLAKNLLKRRIGQDLTLIGGVLEIVLLDVFPDFTDHLAAWKRL